MNNKVKGIFINLFLVCAMVLSVIGGAILMSPSINAKVKADNVTLGKPSDVKFTAAKTNMQTSAYDNVNGFVYEGAQLNYVEINNITYFYKSGENSKLYIDEGFTEEAKDITIHDCSEESGKRYFKVSLRGSDTQLKCEVITSIYITTHNDIRYYLKPDGNLYNNMNTNRPTEDFVYTVQYKVDATITSTGAVITNKTTSLQDTVIDGISGYYQISSYTYYVKKGVSNELYEINGNKKAVKVDASGLKIQPDKIFVHSLYTTPNTKDNFNIYTILYDQNGENPKELYVYNGHLYDSPVFYQPTKLPNDTFNTTTDGVEVKYNFTGNTLALNDQLYEVIINNKTYYAMKSGRNLYDANVSIVSPSEFSLISIDETSVVVKYASQNANNVTQSFFIGDTVLSVDSTETTIGSDKYYQVNNSPYYIKKTDGTTLDTTNLYIIDGSATKVIESGFKIKSITETQVTIMEEYYCINTTVCKKRNENQIKYDVNKTTGEIESSYIFNDKYYFEETLVNGSPVKKMFTQVKKPEAITADQLPLTTTGDIVAGSNISMSVSGKILTTPEFSLDTFNYNRIDGTNYLIKQGDTSNVYINNYVSVIDKQITPESSGSMYYINGTSVESRQVDDVRLDPINVEGTEYCYISQDDASGNSYAYKKDDATIHLIKIPAEGDPGSPTYEAPVTDNKINGMSYSITAPWNDGSFDYITITYTTTYSATVATTITSGTYYKIGSTEYYRKDGDAVNIYTIDGDTATAVEIPHYIITNVSDTQVTIMLSNGTTQVFNIDKSKLFQPVGHTLYYTLIDFTIPNSGDDLAEEIYVKLNDKFRTSFKLTNTNSPEIITNNVVLTNVIGNTAYLNLTFNIDQASEITAEGKKYYAINFDSRYFDTSVFTTGYYALLGSSGSIFTTNGSSTIKTYLNDVNIPFNILSFDDSGSTGILSTKTSTQSNGGELDDSNMYNLNGTFASGQNHGYYYINGFTIYVLTNRSVQSSFVNFNSTYYYMDALLYIAPEKETGGQSNVVQDFDYTPNINQVLINSTYNNIETATFNYVQIDGATYYINDNKLYTSIVIGGAEKTRYTGEVTNTDTGYDINTTYKYIAFFRSNNYGSVSTFLELSEPIVFNEGSPSEFTLTHSTKINDIDAGELQYFDSTGNMYTYDGVNTPTRVHVKSAFSEIEIPLKAYVIQEGIYYYVGTDNELYYLYKKDATNYTAIHYSLMNINYEATMNGEDAFKGDATETFTVNGLSAKIESFQVATDDPATQYLLYNARMNVSGNEVYDPVPSNSANKIDQLRYVVLYTGTTVEVYINLTKGYITVGDLKQYETIEDYRTANAQLRIVESNKYVNGTKTTISDSFGDFYIATDNKVYFSTSYSQYSGTTFNGYTINETNKTLQNPTTGLDYTQERFSYSIVTGSVNVLAKQEYKDKDNSGNQIKRELLGFTVAEVTKIELLSYEYFTSNRIDYVVGSYEGTTKIYSTITYNHEVQNSKPKLSDTNEYSGTDETELFAEYVKIKYQATNYTLQSSVSATYQLHESLTNKFDDGSIVMLNNFETKSNLINKTTGTDNKIDVVYLGFNEKLEGIGEDLTSGIIQLTVQGFLKNDYVMKFYSTSSSYNEDYGINININSPVEENVTYASQIGYNVNYYWYQHLDLTGLKANIDYSLNEDQDGKIKLENIEDTSGLYTFIFDFTHVKNGQSTVYKYIYTFYLIESSDYIEYPTFNTLLSENSESFVDEIKDTFSKTSSVTVADGANAGTYYPLVTQPYFVKDGVTDKLYEITFTTGQNPVVESVKEYANAKNIDIDHTEGVQSVEYEPIYVFDKVVEDITEASSSANMAFSYNNQKFDKPTYIYDASKYNVSYNFKYNLESHNFTTEFEIHNPGRSNEFGILRIYRDSQLYTTYRLEIIELANKTFAVNYYLGTTKDNLYGSIYVNEKGNYYLSLENYFYYNNKNFNKYITANEYYRSGRLVKNGAENTPATYVMALVFEELGDYTFTNKYIISQGNSADINIATFKVDDQITTDTLQNKYTFSTSSFKVNGTDTGSISFNGGVISRFGSYNIGTGDFILDFSSGSVDKDTTTLSSIVSSPTLKIYGISTTFTKNGKELPFRKIDENILSDITPNTTFSGHDQTTTFDIKAKDTLIDGDFKQHLDFGNNYRVPLTNLQPIYFTYFGDFIYNESFYYRYQDCSYTTDEYGNILSVDFTKSKKSIVQFTNKTSISSSGFYIVKVVYKHTAIANNNQTQYFMFAIDNSAPKLEIYTMKDAFSSGELFISNTEFTQTSRYSNRNMIYASWNTPTHFQGEISVSYQRRSYDGNTILETVSNYDKESVINTSNCQYIFTINYGVNKVSNSSTHIIIDKTKPTGDLYSTILNNNGTYALKELTPNRIFNEPVTFVTDQFKTASGAKVYARLLTISFNAHDNYAQAIMNGPTVDAITTNVEIDANSTLFDTYSRLDNSPTYNYFNKAEALTGADVAKSQLIGLSNQSVIYIMKLYDEAGNYQIYYFIFDTSKPYILYKLTNETDFKTSFEDNTTQYNTEIVWGNYKAIHINNEDSTNELYLGLVEAVSTLPYYGGTKLETSNTGLHMYVPINKTTISTKFNQVDREATTYLGSNFTHKSTIFIEKYINNDLINEVRSANPMSNFIFNEGDGGATPITASNYAQFFIGSKYYKFKITDISGNELSKRLSLNSSFALEKFYGEYNGGSYELAADQAYNIVDLKTRFKSLSEQSFRANISYDYYNIDFENYLTLNPEGIDSTNTPYTEFGYDLQNNIVYLYTSNGFVERIYSEEQKTYIAKYDYAIEEDRQYYYSYVEILEQCNGNFYVPGYPYVLSAMDVKVDTSIDPEDPDFLLSNTIYSENGETKTGLYVFKRTYIDNKTGKEISQTDINNPDNVDYEVLKNDSAVKYHIYYVDRNNIINLSYDATGIIDEINSIGNMLQIFLGQDREGNKDPVIDAEILSAESINAGESQSITTNKLKVITNFTLDKYATKEKLKEYPNYTIPEINPNESINDIGEKSSITRNLNIFKYYVTITHTNNGNVLVKDNQIVDSRLVSLLADNNEPSKKLFSLFSSGLYTITITDNSFVENNDGVRIPNSENSLRFQFGINHSSPDGNFITLLDDNQSVKEISVKKTSTSAAGSVKQFESSSVENLSFRFSDSSSDFDATVDPYKIVVERRTYGNNTGEVIFRTGYKFSTSYYNTFSTNIPDKQKVQVLQVFDKNGNDIYATHLDDGAPYTYQINIFDKNNINLLSDYSKDYVYVVKLEYMGNNSSDYTVTSINGDVSNYFSTTFTIHIDRTAPEYNLNALIAADNNLDFYCLDKYGVTFNQLTSAVKQEVINSYAFPVKYISQSNIAKYYAKDNLGASYNNLNETNKALEKRNILTTYSTIFHQDDDSNDSKQIYFQRIGNNLKDYKFSILPSDPAYNEGGSYQDHPRFNQSSERYILADYSQQEFIFSNYLTEDPNNANAPVFENAYYEVIEEDEAGNLSRYLIYASDNTDVNLNFRYFNSNKDNVVDANGNIEEDSLFFIYENEPLYVRPCTPIIENSSGFAIHRRNESGAATQFTKLADGELNINDISFKYYYHSNEDDPIKIPFMVNYKGTQYKLQSSNINEQLNGYLFIDQNYENDSPLNCLNMSSLHLLNETVEGATGSFLFDEFFTIRIFQDNVEALRFVSDPYADSYSNHSFLQRVAKELRALIANSAGVYSYRLELINRSGYSNYNLSFNLPDQELLLKYNSPTLDSLTVTLPKASDFVKLIRFEAYMYDETNKTWRLLTTDSLKNPIQTHNDDGLPEITYTFGIGQYKFVTLDNFGRGNGTNGNGEYKIVGDQIDETYNFSYTKAHIIDNTGTIVTSGSASLLINNNIYQIRAILKNAVRLDISDGTGNIVETKYYTLISENEGNVTKLYRYDNDPGSQTYGQYVQQFLNGTAISDNTEGNTIYYYRGSLYKDINYKNEIVIQYTNPSGIDVSAITVYPSTPNQLVYKTGNKVNDKTYLTFDSICANSMAEYQIEIAWTTEPDNVSVYKLKIDRNAPRLILLNQSGSLAAIENQNYNKPFTISWTSNYKTTAELKRTVNATTTIIKLSASDNYEINMIAGYTLRVVDEIGNENVFNFNYVKNANEYFSVFVDQIEIFPSDYVSTYEGKTIKWYYYDASVDPENVVVKTDETKNIGKVKATADVNNAYDYKIIRTNLDDYIICYVKLVPVNATDSINDFVSNIIFNKTDGSTETFLTTVSGGSNTNNYLNVNESFEFDYMKNQDYDSFVLNVNKNLMGRAADGKYNVDYVGNKIFVDHYYNDQYIRTYSSDSWSKLSGSGFDKNTPTYFPITISSTGVHRFEFRDTIGNKTRNIQVTLIKDIMFTANDVNPINYRIYNSEVVLNVPNTHYYNNITVKATLNGKELNTAEINKDTKYTFTEAGYYEVVMSATAQSQGDPNEEPKQYESIYRFTIINPNVTKMTFGFSNNYGFTISQVIKNQADITNQIISESRDSMWLTSGNEDSIGTYTITLIGYDKLSNEYSPFTFVVKLNNETPTITSPNYVFGSKTTKSITLQFNAAVIYSQVGESYIRVIGDNGQDARFDINADSEDFLESLYITKNGKYRVTIYNKDGIFITSYYVHKAAPLNTSAKIIIVVASLVIIALTVTFIVLRRHTKFR